MRAQTDKTNDGIKVLAAACLALNQVGEGSSPSDPTRKASTGRASGEDAAPVMRRVLSLAGPRFESHPVLSIFDNLARLFAPMM